MPACCAVLDSLYRRAVDSIRVNAPPAVLTAVVKVWLRLPRWTPGLVRWQEAAVLYFPRADWRTACCISGVGATPGRIVWHG